MIFNIFSIYFSQLYLQYYNIKKFKLVDIINLWMKIKNQFHLSFSNIQCWEHFSLYNQNPLMFFIEREQLIEGHDFQPSYM
jgi:hypothetical protein